MFSYKLISKRMDISDEQKVHNFWIHSRKTKFDYEHLSVKGNFKLSP